MEKGGKEKNNSCLPEAILRIFWRYTSTTIKGFAAISKAPKRWDKDVSKLKEEKWIFFSILPGAWKTWWLEVVFEDLWIVKYLGLQGPLKSSIDEMIR